MGCNCSKNSQTFVNLNVQRTTPFTEVTDENCSKTKEEILTLRDRLLALRNPENSGNINSKLGLIDTMINYNKFCLYNIEI